MGSVKDKVNGSTGPVKLEKVLMPFARYNRTLHVLVYHSIHETLTKLQQEQLERLRQWLTATEDRISQLAAVPQPETLTAADQMLQDHQSLQRDLEAQQEHVNALSNMVVIVDESVSDSKDFLDFHTNLPSVNFDQICFDRLRSDGRSAFGLRGKVESCLQVG